MTPREGFKFGFLLRCAEEGLTAAEAQERAARAEKRAQVGSAIWNLGTKIPGAAWDLGTKGLVLGTAGVAGIGGLGGYGLAKMQEGEVDPAEIQRQELIDAYTSQAELARRKAIMSAARNARPRPRSRHGI
jgi:hypothetical protein